MLYIVKCLNIKLWNCSFVFLINLVACSFRLRNLQCDLGFQTDAFLVAHVKTTSSLKISNYHYWRKMLYRLRTAKSDFIAICYDLLWLFSIYVIFVDTWTNVHGFVTNLDEMSRNRYISLSFSIKLSVYQPWSLFTLMIRATSWISYLQFENKSLRILLRELESTRETETKVLF